MPSPSLRPGDCDTENEIRSNLTAWATYVLEKSELTPANHHHLLLQNLDALSRGETDRLMVLMPPGSAKSTYVSILFPAWWFVQHPRSSIIAASHTAALAQHFGRQIRALVAEHSDLLGYRLAVDNRAAARWQTSRQGEYFATGVRGSITGRRADLAIIDDPIKSQAESLSPLQRESLWNWYRFDLTTRLKPKGRIILVMTRWHDEDLAGRLIAQDRAEWQVLRLPALAEADDPLGRTVGEALWPEWEDAAALLRKRATIGERAWWSLFQQSPRPLQGSLFKVPRIEILDDLPENANGRVVRAWDFAATPQNGSNDPDWTVGLKLLRDPSGRWIILDLVRLRGSPRQVEQAIVETAQKDGPSVTVCLPEDPGQAGKIQVAYFTRMLAGYPVTSSRESGSKLVRAMPLASQVEAGNVMILRAAWNHALLEELRDFPYGRKDDQVDAFARAFAVQTENAAPARRITVPLFSR